MPDPADRPADPDSPSATAPRQTYRHGDLRRALLDAGVALAREGGPQAVVLREATRRAGVAPNAAYRHFANRQDLLEAVRAVALAQVARAMEAELAAVPATLAPHEHACAGLRAVGAGYLRFAREETGLFRTAFAAAGDIGPGTPNHAEKTGATGLDPFQLLGGALDRMVAAGALPPERRPGAEFLAWSAVHGLALLVIDGPLARVVGPQMDRVAQRLLDMVEKGL
ncbi:TetR/AcrR family transcriptional regulator [Paracidovorax valerianellae]|uniref:Transcriptional regulator, TetR family n=1 Tax=Paracidovorax valerianellae TaxID=187868 RepID=A0A1G6S9B9_9BURK|nr:TetR/AcrR family transcriptional regulator [Paracidovorax valerianellae]MDA8444223.1 TetR/AcrR family transcriptional regulator [Paracidovorax valerianellae]SDD13264.1 transcriptional regulator, TetR family [Paracidovorax valerianellae]